MLDSKQRQSSIINKTELRNVINTLSLKSTCRGYLIASLVNYLVSKILGTEMSVDLENLGTRQSWYLGLDLGYRYNKILGTDS